VLDTTLELVFACIIFLAVGGMGQFLLGKVGITFNNRLEEVSFAFAIGLGCLVIIVLFLGLSHLLYDWLIIGIVFVGLAIGTRGMSRLQFAPRSPMAGVKASLCSIHFWLLLLTGIGLGLNLFRALAPPHSYTDPLAYQLALPKIFLEKHFLSFEKTITGGLYPSNMGLLFAVGLALKDGTLAQVIHWSMGLLCALAIWGFGERYFDRTTGIWGAVLFCFVPIVVIFAPQGYIDVGLCYFQFMAFWAVFNWAEERTARKLILAGVLTGLAMGVKHQGIATALVGGAIVFAVLLRGGEGWRATMRDIAIYMGCALLMVLPWYLRSYYWAGNPIWPLANRFFDGLDFGLVPSIGVGSEGKEEGGKLLGGLIPSMDWFRLYSRSMSPWLWTFNPFSVGGGQKDIGGYFIAFLPGILIFLRGKKRWMIAAFCLVYYLILIRFLHMNPRYGIVLFAFLCVLCGHVASRISSSRSRLLSAIFRTFFLLTVGCNLLLSYALARPVFGVVTGKETKEAFLRKSEGSYRAFQFINSNLPQSSIVLFQGMVKGYYCDRSYLWGDHPHSGVIDYRQFGSPEQLIGRFSELGISHIVRIINLPPVRTSMYPDYFRDSFQENFRKKYLNPLYWDESFIVFEVVYAGRS
jgi:hypothetical protein